MDATRYLPFLGRLLIGLPFAMSGFGKLAAYGKTTLRWIFQLPSSWRRQTVR